jgi:four helix bundle protein
MFDFEKLDVYQKAKVYHQQISTYLPQTKITSSERDQLKRASMSIVLNIAEGSGRFTKPDKRNFYIIARSSVFETVALLELLLENKIIDPLTQQKFYLQAEELSKMLFSLIRGLEG